MFYLDELKNGIFSRIDFSFFKSSTIFSKFGRSFGFNNQHAVIIAKIFDGHFSGCLGRSPKRN